MSTNRLYYGDNLEVLRKEIPDESVDLIYLDPPFNSNANYNILFKSPKTGEGSHSQIEAFDDTWHWGPEAQKEFDEIVRSSHTELAELIQALRHFLKENDMMAYLVMMASRLVELHRVMRPTGSLYLHCDPTASHYLKLVLDAVFGLENFQSEIIWKRTTAHSNVYKAYGDITDSIFFFSKSENYTWNQQYKFHTNEENDKRFPLIDKDGRRWRSENLRNPGIRPNLHYPYTASNGITYQPHPNGWTCNEKRMRELDSMGRLHFPTDPNGRLRLKLYADENPGVKLQNLWDDISPIGAQAQERLGYPTQKPVALLERIISTSTNEGDIVLDPFCGCGTAVHAAEKLNRKWIGIDITHLSISLIERRMREAFPDVQFEVHGTPKDLESARDLATRDKYQFQWWAISLVRAQPFQGKKKGADSGIDGLIFFKDDQTGDFKKIIVSVKGGEHINVSMIRDLKGTIEREKAAIGLFITLAEPTAPMKQEAASAPLYKSPLFPNGIYPSIQILTIEGLMNKTQKPEYPNLYLGDLAFKRAEKEVKVDKGQSELF